jgi:hypothetical protein
VVKFVGSGQGDNHMFERFLSLHLAHLQINVLFLTNSSLLMSLVGDFGEIGMNNLHVEDVYLDQRLLGGYQGPQVLDQFTHVIVKDPQCYQRLRWLTRILIVTNLPK